MKIIANPRAGHGRNLNNLERLQELMKRRGLDCELLKTERPGHATELARRAVESGSEELMVMGGDGTIGEVIDGVVHSNVVLGLISVGTGNDLARSLGLPYNNLEGALNVMLSGKPRAIDIGRERERHFVLTLGLGFPATVAHEANKMIWLKGSPAFFVAVYKALYRLKPVPMRLVLDDQTLDLECTSVLVQNTPYCGGGQLMAPGAQLDDGFFDVLTVDAIGRLDLMVTFPKVYSGRHLDHPSFCLYRSRSVTIDCPVPMPKMFDGDICGETPVEATVLHRSVRVMVPA